MEPILAAALALGTVVGTKALEKTGEGIGEALVKKTKDFLTNLKRESPTTVTAIVEHTPNQPLNYSQIIPAIQAAAEKQPELMAQIEELAALGQKEPKLMPYIQEAKQSNYQKYIVNQMRDNYGVIAEKIDKNVQINNVEGDVHI